MKKILICLWSVMLSLNAVNVNAANKEINYEIGLDGTVYRVEKSFEYGCEKIEIYNNETNEFLIGALTKEVVFTSPIEENSDNFIGIKSLVDTYDKWILFGIAYSKQITIDFTTTTTVNALIGLLGIIFPALSWGAWGAGIVQSLATEIFNQKYKNVYANVYRSTNKHCDILIREYAKFYSNRNKTKLIKTSGISVIWTSTPWDYGTQPAACRTLTEKY